MDLSLLQVCEPVLAPMGCCYAHFAPHTLCACCPRSFLPFSFVLGETDQIIPAAAPAIIYFNHTHTHTHITHAQGSRTAEDKDTATTTTPARRMGEANTLQHRTTAAAVMTSTFTKGQQINNSFETLEEEYLGQHMLGDLAAAMGASALVAPFVRYVDVCVCIY